MGRKKIATRYIEDEKCRKLSFDQRIKGLKKKISDITKSGAKACLIMYGDGNVGAMTWPENPAIVKSMLQEYVHQKIEKTPKIFDAKDYFEIKKDMAKAQIIKVRKDILKNKYPTWYPRFNSMDENQLRGFIGTIDAKIAACNLKISNLKGMHQSETGFLQNTPHMKNIVQESVGFTNHADLCHDSSKNQPDDDVYEMVDFTNLVQESVDLTNHADLCHKSSKNQPDDDIYEMMDFTNLVQESVDFTNNTDLCHNSSSKNQLDDDIYEMLDFTNLGQESVDFTNNSDLCHNSSKNKLDDDVYGMVDFTDLGDLPPSSSKNQLSKLVQWDDQVVNHEDWANQFGNDWNYITELDRVDWQDLSFLSQNEKGSAMV